MNRVAIRLIGAPLLLAALGACLYVDSKRMRQGHPPLAIPAVLCFFSVWSFRELCAMGRLKGLKPYEWIGWLLLPVPYVLVMFEEQTGIELSRTDLFVLLAALAGLALVLSLLFHAASRSARSTLYTVLMFGYVNLLACTLYMKDRGDLFLWWLLFLLATGKGSDMAAYSVGKSIGRHKMAPRISPNKTWEGAIGGLIAGTLLGWWVLEASPIDSQFFERNFLAMAAFVCIAAQIGDLMKSAVKRWAGVKDSGRLIPEFGGTLDMIDSFILNAPAAILAYEIMRLVSAPR
jgi:phosphatidate cytidylyltransferase